VFHLAPFPRDKKSSYMSPKVESRPKLTKAPPDGRKELGIPTRIVLEAAAN
jgi:hypothetical protein